MTSQIPEDFYKSFFDNMIDGLLCCQIVFDRQSNPVDFICIRINKNFEKLAGLESAAKKGAAKIKLMIDKLIPGLSEVVFRVSSAGKLERFEVYLEPSAKWLLVSVYKFKKDFVTVIFQDITRRKEIEKEFENSKIAARNVLEDLSAEKSKVELARAKEEAILLSIGDGLIATDEKGIITIVNKKAEQLLGVKKKEITGKFFLDVIFMENEKGAPILLKERPISMVLATGMTVVIAAAHSYYYTRKNGIKFPIATVATPVILNEKIIGTIEVFRDITWEKEIDKVKTEFVSFASHQLRTPLSAVRWYTEMLLDNDAGELNDGQRDYIQEIYNSSLSMVSLVNTLLNVSRLELGTFSLALEKIDILQIADQAVKELQPIINEKKIKFVRKYDKDLPPINLDRNLINIIFQNLLSNAIKYTLGNRKVELKIKKRKTFAEIIVSDAGIGIPENQKARIFEKFFRADNVKKIYIDSVGLGLYITKSILDQFGGKIWFKSKENKGTTFHVSIPLEGMAKKRRV